jgi:hypothetical protein
LAKLRTYVHVADDEGQAHAFGPDDDLPAWAVEKITNPKAWAVPPAATAPEPAPTPAPAKKAAPARKAPARRKAEADGGGSTQ